jgi:hypothetical protein
VHIAPRRFFAATIFVIRHDACNSVQGATAMSAFAATLAL